MNNKGCGSIVPWLLRECCWHVIDCSRKRKKSFTDNKQGEPYKFVIILPIFCQFTKTYVFGNYTQSDSNKWTNSHVAWLVMVILAMIEQCIFRHIFMPRKQKCRSSTKLLLFWPTLSLSLDLWKIFFFFTRQKNMQVNFGVHFFTCLVTQVMFI